MSAEEFRRRVAAGDALRPHDRRAALRSGTGRPMVEWRRRGCGCRVLRLYLTPRCWYLIGDDYRVPPGEWLAMLGDPTLEDGTPVTIEAHRAGDVHLADLRRVEGVTRELPLDPATWEQALFTVGCQHTNGGVEVDLRDLVGDATEVVRTRQPLPARRVVVGHDGTSL